MAWVAVAVGGGALAAGLVGSVLQSGAAKSAAKTQADAANNATNLAKTQYDQTRTDQTPWRQAGTNALTQLQDPSNFKNFTMADFQQDPGYQFRMDQGNKAIERSAAARGSQLSGGTLGALDNYSQGLASQAYGDAYNRFNANRDFRYNTLAGLAGIGQNANSQVNQAGQNYTNAASNNMTGAANASAAGTVGSANAFANGLGTTTNAISQYNLMNRLLPQTSKTQTYNLGPGEEEV